MADMPSDFTPLILRGHVLDMLRTLPGESVQCVVTSPPYWGLRAYGTEPQVWGGEPTHPHEWLPTPPRRERSEDDAGGTINKNNVGASYNAKGGERCSCGAWRGELGLEPTPELYVAHLADVFDEVRRVLREDGTVWLNLGDTYAGGSPVRTDALRKLQRVGDDDYIPFGEEGHEARPPCGIRSKNLVGVPWRVALELQHRGWWLRAECIWAKPNPMPESVVDRPTRAHEQVFLLTKAARYFYDAEAVRRPLAPSTEDRARNHYSNPTDNPDPDSKWGKDEWRSYPVIGRRYAPSTLRELDQGYEGRATKEYGGTGAQDPSAVKARIIAGARRKAEAGTELYANLKTVWWIPTEPYPEAHFATFPRTLAETCIRAGTSEKGACGLCGAPLARKLSVRPKTQRLNGVLPKQAAAPDGVRNNATFGSYPGWRKDPYWTTLPVTTGWALTCSCSSPHPVSCVVLDPFSGSGTVLQVARSMGRRSIGIELKEEYVALARRRSSADVPSLERFAADSAGAG